MAKPTVQCRLSSSPVVNGQAAYVYPVDHPANDRVSNMTLAQTSPVRMIEWDGNEVVGFETANTHYRVIA